MSLVVEKYTYPKLEREMISGVRHYTDGETPVPSVTTILSETGDKTALFEWRKRVGDAEANRISRDYEVLRKNYEDRLQDREELRTRGNVVDETSQYKFDLIDPPVVPQKPAAPNRPLLLHSR